MPRRLLSSLLLYLCLHLLPAQAKAMEQTDSLAYDKAKVALYQQSGRYDYNEQLSMREFSLWEICTRWLNRQLKALFGGEFADSYTKPILIAVACLFILAVIFFIVRKRPDLFFNEKKSQAYLVEQETIHGINFDDELRRSLQAEDYKLAIRLSYLQTLKQLNARSLIDWQIYKTPTEYTYELKEINLRSSFRLLTNHFLRVRYGNFDADKQTYEEVRNLQAEINNHKGEGEGGKAHA